MAFKLFRRKARLIELTRIHISTPNDDGYRLVKIETRDGRVVQRVVGPHDSMAVNFAVGQSGGKSINELMAKNEELL